MNTYLSAEKQAKQSIEQDEQDEFIKNAINKLDVRDAAASKKEHKKQQILNLMDQDLINKFNTLYHRPVEKLMDKWLSAPSLEDCGLSYLDKDAEVLVAFASPEKLAPAFNRILQAKIAKYKTPPTVSVNYTNDENAAAAGKLFNADDKLIKLKAAYPNMNYLFKRVPNNHSTRLPDVLSWEINIPELNYNDTCYVSQWDSVRRMNSKLTELVNDLNTNNFNDVYDQLNTLYEGSADRLKYNASKAFWDDAKNGILNTADFHRAYNDDLRSLGLLDEFDWASGKLKAKGSYGKLKQADQSLWPVKAAIKFWVLQFKDNARTREEIDAEKRAEETARRQAEAEEAARIKKEKCDWLHEHTDDFKEATLKAAQEYDLTEYLELLTRYFELNNIVYERTDKIYPDDFKNNINIDLHREDEKSIVFVLTFGTKNRGNTFHEIYPDYSAIDVTDDLDAEAIKEVSRCMNVNKHYMTDRLVELEKRAEAVKEREARDDKAYSSRADFNTNLRATISLGEEPDKVQMGVIEEVITRTKNLMRSEREAWADSTDGSEGAAVDGAAYKGALILSDLLYATCWKAGGYTCDTYTSEDDCLDMLHSLMFKNDIKFVFTGVNEKAGALPRRKYY